LVSPAFIDTLFWARWLPERPGPEPFFMRQLFLLLLALSPLCVIATAQDQDSPSLGDVARQNRTQKQQKDTKDSQAKDAPTRDPSEATPATDVVSRPSVAAKASRVITNEDLPEHTAPAAPPASNSELPGTTNPDPGGSGRQQLAEQFKSRIQDQKNAITQLQNQVAAVSDSIHYAGGNCVSNCVQWNEHQQRKQQEVDSMKAQLEEAERSLEQMRQAARQEGFGSSVSDPD
jgi:hypothetical protein